MRQTVVGIFDSESEAQTAVQKLLNDGFRHENVDISGQTSNYQNQGNDYQNSSSDNNEDFGDKIGKFFNNLFGSESGDSRNYTEAARRGSVVTVHADSEEEAERAVDILDLYGAVDVDERAASYGTNTSGSYLRNDTYGTENQFRSDDVYSTDDEVGRREYKDNLDVEGSVDRAYEREAMRDDLSEDRFADRENSIPIVEENLNVGKREVEKGGVRIRSRIIERPVEENLRLRSERVNVERNPVNRPATEADFNSFREGSIEVTQREEVPVVNKEARVVEEVSVGKEVEERTENVRDTVRKTEVDVENFDSDNNEFRNRDRDNLRDGV